MPPDPDTEAVFAAVRKDRRRREEAQAALEAELDARRTVLDSIEREHLERELAAVERQIAAMEAELDARDRVIDRLEDDHD